MKVINARNVNGALQLGASYLKEAGIKQASRYGDTVEAPTPVATVYQYPCERVLFDPIRDANPYFHLMESIWMLAGRNDVEFLVQFNSRMGEFSDNGETYHGAYGYRWRQAFGFDQLGLIVDQLKANPDDRRAVLQIWDSRLDLAKASKDIPCNDLVMFKVRKGRLNMTVANRSNDMIWGCYGANAVHFSVLQEYVAGHIGVPVGTYTQVSDSFHAYDATWDKVEHLSNGGYMPDLYEIGHVKPYQLVDDALSFDDDLWCWMKDPAQNTLFLNSFFHNVATPLFRSWKAFKAKDEDGAFKHLNDCRAQDWKRACAEWLGRRYAQKA